MQAIRDENHVPSILAVSNADGVDTVAVLANESTHAVLIDDGVGGSSLSGSIDARDENRVVAFMAVSSADGVTPIPIYADSVTKKLLTKSI
jgi:hypothetical protein